MILISSKMLDMFKFGKAIILILSCIVITLEMYAQSVSQNDFKDKAPRSIMLAPPKKCFIKTMQDYKRHKILGLRKGQANQLEAIQGVRKVPVLLGKFSDTPYDPWNPNELQKELFDGPWPTETMKQYYQAMSYGQFSVDGSVSHWFTVSHSKSYYGTNGRSYDNPHTQEFMKEMLDLGDSSIDFRQFDNDGPDGIPNSGDDDGYVDIVFFVSIGTSGGSLDDIWPHFFLYSLWFGAPYATKDTGINGNPIMIDEYTVQNSSISSGSNPSTVPPIGVFCHEFGHALGLPDLYDIDFSSLGIGFWGLMSYGGAGDFPVGMEAWSKYHLGWITPPVFDEDEHLNLTVRNSYQNSEAYIVKKKGAIDYYLLENRRKIGFDQSIANEGLLIWHVDESKFQFGQAGGYGWDNSGNADDAHRGVDLVKADNEFWREDGDPYPGTTNNHTFDRNSVPNSRDSNGFDTGIEISNILQQDSNIIADVKVHAAYLNSFLTEPPPMYFFNTNNLIKIKGTADGTNLTSYDLDFGEGTDPQSWTRIRSYNSHVIDSTLGVLDPSSLNESIYTIRLTSKDNEGTSVKKSSIYISPSFPAGWPREVDERIVAHSIGVDDIDHDGKVEIVAGESSPTKDNIKLFMWTSDGSVKDSLLWPKSVTGNRITAPALADLDKDGKKEIIFNTSSYLYVLRSDGSNFPGWPKPFSTYSPPVVSDIDGDGNLEILSSETFSPNVFAWQSNGILCPGWPQTMDHNAFFSPVVSDLDNDGKCEIIQKNEYGRLYVWDYSGNLKNGWPTNIQNDFPHYNSAEPIVADLDGDGQKEIITLCGQNAYVFRADGTVASGWPKIFNSNLVRQTLTVSDINNDNKVEIIVASDYITVYDYQGNILPGWPTQSLISSWIDIIDSHTLHPIAADINGDGEIEIILVCNRNITALSNKGQVLDGWPRRIPNRFDQHTTWVPRREFTPLITDINQDGNIELALGAENQVIFWDLGCKIKREHTSWLRWQSNKWNTGEYQFIPSDDVPFTTGPEISCLRTLSLGVVKIGQSKDTTISITNLGNDTLRIASIASSRTEVSSLSSVITIAPNKTIVDTIRFTPTLLGNVTAKLIIVSNTTSTPDTITVTGIGEGPKGIVSDLSNQIPKEYSIAQNFPNPFNAHTIIRYGVPQKSWVRIDIFDVLGKLVATIVDGEREARYYDVHWNKEIASGFYFYRFSATALNDPSKKFIEVRRMVLLK